MSVLKLLISLGIYVPLAMVFDLSMEFVIMGGCILFAGFIAANED